jgi:hypothetical protein
MKQLHVGAACGERGSVFHWTCPCDSCEEDSAASRNCWAAIATMMNRTCGYGGNGIIPTLTNFLFQMSMIVMQLTQIISSPNAARS